LSPLPEVVADGGVRSGGGNKSAIDGNDPLVAGVDDDAVPPLFSDGTMTSSQDDN